MREVSGKWRSVVERVVRAVLGLLQGGVEGVWLLPQLESLLLLGGEVEVYSQEPGTP